MFGPARVLENRAGTVEARSLASLPPEPCDGEKIAESRVSLSSAGRKLDFCLCGRVLAVSSSPPSRWSCLWRRWRGAASKSWSSRAIRWGSRLESFSVPSLVHHCLPCVSALRFYSVSGALLVCGQRELKEGRWVLQCVYGDGYQICLHKFWEETGE